MSHAVESAATRCVVIISVVPWVPLHREGSNLTQPV